MSTRPNIIVILADDAGYGDIGCFGSPDVQTPCLDGLASEGIALTQHYSASPVCAPARAGLLTGKYPHRVGALDVVETRGLDRIALGVPTIADLLKEAGYATGMVGKWHNGAIDPRFHPNARGFEEFIGFRAGIMKYWDWVIERNGSFERSDGRYLTDVFTDEAIQFIQRHRHNPFFLYVAYNAPHTPLEAPDEDVAPFREMGKFTEAVSTIYGMVQRMDAGIGRILETLERLGLAENTLLLFTSDNGPMFAGAGENSTVRYNGQFNGSKYDVLEGGIRVPAVVRWPSGLPAGCSSNSFVHFCDWLPTLLSAGGTAAPDPGDLNGQDVIPLLREEQGQVAPVCFWQWNRYTPVPHSNIAMRDGPWKLYHPPIPEACEKRRSDNVDHARHRENPGAFADIVREPFDRTLSLPRDAMLFNLDDDPYEQQDFAAQQPDRVAAMQKSLDAWFEKVESERTALDEDTRGYPLCLTNDRTTGM
ncbi:MAG: sulfatase-like hydrolase/transferase [Planctomycetes bacterium]|nr:sulfatase-like hydrolase/transferase [Planctomycetota bacterium]